MNTNHRLRLLEVSVNVSFRNLGVELFPLVDDNYEIRLINPDCDFLKCGIIDRY